MWRQYAGQSAILYEEEAQSAILNLEPLCCSVKHLKAMHKTVIAESSHLKHLAIQLHNDR